MPNPRRRERLASVIEEVVSELLQREIRDPRVAGLTSITRVEVTSDVRFAKIFVSVMGTEAERQATMRALERATGFIRSKLGEELTIRHVPAITFQLDRSIEEGDRVLALINQMASEASTAGASQPPGEARTEQPSETKEPG
ncbi:MAG: 30S ribosome-binding factor RbfA [Chloroflexota bacterium]